MTPANPLRVTALAASAQLGGTERVLLDFAARAFEHAISLRVLTPRDGPLIAILNQIGVPAAVVPAPLAMLRGSQQPGRLWSAIPGALALPYWAGKLRAHPFANTADILYSVGFKTHLATTMPLGKKVVWHLHEFPPETTGLVWKMLSARVPHAMIANSVAVAKAWRDQTADRMTVVPNGVDLDRFKPMEPRGWVHQALGVPREARLIGMPAVFARWKGHELVIDAFRSIANDFPDVHLVFAGGSIYDTVAERAFSKQLNALMSEHQRIHALPFQPKIESLYPELDLVVHYSLRPEPFGRVILEAMACGVPVLAADEGGPVEILGAEPASPSVTPAEFRPAIGGWLVTPRNPAGLATALRHALSVTAEERKKVGHLGRVRAEDHFSARAFARGVAQVLLSLK